MQAVDLSHPVVSGMQVFPGDPAVHIRNAASVEADGFQVAELHLGSHTGTHLDAPLHTVPGGAAVDELPLENLLGSARIVSVPGAAELGRIRWQDVAAGLEGLLPGTIVLFSTGWSEHFNTHRYLRHPSFDAEIAERLVDAGIRLVGMDTLNPDPTPAPGSGGVPSLPFHDVFLGAGGGIIENLTNLAAVTWSDPLFSALPLRLAGVDGSPIRAAAFQL
ncbi:cyclase family protein [Arthrobacter sp. zg-Y820]|uniref:cyclase family protein n=1 Tax=unclassified Arthrobacter TaxID=235627 RepID=UPI001E45FA93|nr:MULTISPECIES: cyclase family protein [unclassified Arthrobacter]MCC9197750.1 cyclase family protein [Arthrobacter sp. zg-Y820]MDK1280617.1 cyclase family protein [Arthrobacter sp. zg.Y820]WIB10747.1 cyclase family protein [Arthrobacter sp. zg-Y820]